MMKKVNRAITGMVINRYVGDTGKNIFFTAPSTLGLERSAARGEGSVVAVMPCLLDPVLVRVHAEVRMARRLKAPSIDDGSPLTLPVSIISWMKFPIGIVSGTYFPGPW